jgi:hypothetical protein
MATVQLDSSLADVQLDIKDDEGGSQSTDDGANYFFEQRRKKGVPQEEEEDFTEEAEDHLKNKTNFAQSKLKDMNIL